MSERLYEVSGMGKCRLIYKDVTGRVLVEATKRVVRQYEWPQVINPGYREWVGPYAVSPTPPAASREGRP